MQVSNTGGGIVERHVRTLQALSSQSPESKSLNDHMYCAIYWATLILVITLSDVCNSQDDEGGDLDAIIHHLEILSSTAAPSTARPPVVETCRKPDGQTGQCVAPSRCSEALDNEDGIGIIDIRELNGPCSSYLLTCCSSSKVVIVPTSSGEVQRKGCGWRNPNGVGLRTTGHVNREAKFGEFPWMVAILTSRVMKAVWSDQLSYVGGGSLIHPNVVLSAAHVVLNSTSKPNVGEPGARPAPLRVRAGEWDTQTDKEPHPHQDRDVANLVVHSEYNKRNLRNDVALLFLKNPMILAPNVGLACLPPPGQRAPGGAKCLASGWGTDRFELAGQYQVLMKKVELPIVESANCQTQMRRSRLGPFFKLHDSFMCAGGERGQDTCVGDGGSPLVCPLQTDRYVQNGIVSWGLGCGDDNTPGVYVDVAAVRTWIDRNVAAAGFDTSIYTL
ncbi:phenoloxidase-activating factor 2-like [Battus philenor]|uniref:phenoloxidase-activating factor 2-like n=1 Tax=Battus philenor TaxID=42288 RepID=UPI0035CF92A8